MYDIIVGRSEADRQKFGTAGTVLLGKHYIKMGQTNSLANKIFMDVTRSHVMFVCGKRGGGKSYSLGVIAEGLADLPQEIKQNLSFILLDTMGVFWSMKYPNHKDELLLNEWGLRGKGQDVVIYTPTMYYTKYKQEGIPTDAPFSIKPSELTSSDWVMTFGLDENDPLAVVLEKTVHNLKENGQDYDIDDMIVAVEADHRQEQHVKDAIINRLLGAKEWGVFDKEGTPIGDLAKGGQVTVLDVSCYATMPSGWNIKSLIVGLISQKLFIERMVARKTEEYTTIHHAEHYFSDEDDAEKKQEMPMVWLVLDEAHEFLPLQGKNAATDPLVTILREGRQPGISLILATQQPGKIHTDVMTQSDIVLAHRITAKPDVDALGMLMQSYMREGLNVQLDNIPRVTGAALIFDDSNEKLYPMRIRPRFTWHAGESPTAMKEKKKMFKF
ncbi:ATP-binding protein [Candidatus Woesearchaeota archaeon]|nr:ATP-binding protein [Candidatus Woesearchaeota archaeon]